MPPFTAETSAGELFGHTPAVQQQHSKPAGLHPALQALQSGRLGVTFSGSGFGAAYQLGAAHMLSNLHCLTQQGMTAVLTADTPVAGTSAGGFVAAACRCSVSYLDVLSALKQASSDLLQHGQARRMRSTMQPLMERILPDNAHELCSSSSSTMRNAAAPSAAAAQTSTSSPAAPSHVHVQQKKKGAGAGLAQAPAGSAAAAAAAPAGTAAASSSSAAAAAADAAPPPFVLSATRVSGPCPACWRGDPVQGGFASKADLVDRLLAGAHEPLISDGRCFARRRGKLLVDGGIRLPVAPIPGVAYSLIILAMPNQLQRRLWPYRLLMHPPGPAAIAISPGQYRAWPYSRNFKQSENLVMKPKPPEVLDMLFERGRRDALAWAQHVGLDALLPAPETQSPTAAEAVTADGMAGKGTKAAGVEGGGDAAVWQEMRSWLGMPPGELPLMLAVPAELQRML